MFLARTNTKNVCPPRKKKPGRADCPVGRGHQDDAEIDDDLDPDTEPGQGCAHLASGSRPAHRSEYPGPSTLIPDAPALSADEKLRFLRSWLTCLATSLAKVFAPLAGGDAPLRLQQLMLDRLAHPSFGWQPSPLPPASMPNCCLPVMHLRARRGR